MVGFCYTLKGPQLVPLTQQTVHRMADRSYAHIPALNPPAVQEPSFLPTKWQQAGSIVKRKPPFKVQY